MNPKMVGRKLVDETCMHSTHANKFHATNTVNTTCDDKIPMPLEFYQDPASDLISTTSRLDTLSSIIL